MPQFESNVFLSQLFWMFICLGIIYFSLSRKAIPRITAIFSERSKKIEGQLREAESLKLEADQMLHEIDQQLKQAHKEANEIISVALHEVNLLSTHRKNEFADIMKRQLTASERKITRKKQAAYKEVREIAVNTAVTIINSIVPVKIDVKDAEAHVNSLMSRSEGIAYTNDGKISNAS